MEVTVVIPAHNAEAFLQAALDTVRAQTLYPRETIVVDDGSTDRTPVIAAAWGARLVRQDNRGVSAARNAGVHAASTPWIAFLDADDLWLPAKLALQARALEACPEEALCFTDMEQFDDDGVLASSFLALRANYADAVRQPLDDGVVHCPRESLAAAFLRGNFINPSTMLVRRDLLLEVGLFDTGFGHAEDRDLCLRLLRRTGAVVVERSLVRYRIHPGGASKNALRMALGAATVADRVLAHPERYPEGAADYYRADRPRRLHQAGVLLLEAGDAAGARRLLARSFAGRPRVRTAAALLVTLLGRSAFLGLRGAKRRLNLPGLR